MSRPCTCSSPLGSVFSSLTAAIFPAMTVVTTAGIGLRRIYDLRHTFSIFTPTFGLSHELSAGQWTLVDAAWTLEPAPAASKDNGKTG